MVEGRKDDGAINLRVKLCHENLICDIDGVEWHILFPGNIKIFLPRNHQFRALMRKVVQKVGFNCLSCLVHIGKKWCLLFFNFSTQISETK